MVFSFIVKKMERCFYFFCWLFYVDVFTTSFINMCSSNGYYIAGTIFMMIKCFHSLYYQSLQINTKSMLFLLNQLLPQSYCFFFYVYLCFYVLCIFFHFWVHLIVTVFTNAIKFSGVYQYFVYTLYEPFICDWNASCFMPSFV